MFKLFIPCLFMASVHAEEAPQLVVFGDSFTSGVLADTQMGNSEDFGRFISRVFDKLDIAAARTLQKDGFKTEDFFNKIEGQASRSDLSFFLKETGLRSLIGNHHQSPPASVRGVFSWGKRFQNLDDQIARLKANKDIYKQGSQKKKVDYVSLGFGGNDYCGELEVDRFRDRVTEAITMAHDFAPEARIILSKLPNMEDLHRIDHTYDMSLKVKTPLGSIKEKIKVTSCDKMRAKYCRALNKDIGRWRSYNEVIDEIAANNSDIRVIQMQEIAIDSSYLAVDCFHPNRKTHNAMNELLQL